METMVATMTEDGLPLWEEECVEFLIQRNGGPRYRFAVNPLGAQCQGKEGDAGWEGEWHAETKQYSSGWAAELSIPFSLLEHTPKKGEVWNFDVIRHRRNVRDEHSFWAYREEAGEGALGRLVFN
jgi:hypothetical protein